MKNGILTTAANNTFNALTLIALLMLSFASTADETVTPSDESHAIEQVASLSQVNINNADAKTLAEKLNGVGEKKAAAIVAWRDANGQFESVEQLTEVKGIGQGLLEKNRANVSL